jgi:hypothetical protein
VALPKLLIPMAMPSSVVWFERLMIAAVLVALASVVLTLQRQGNFGLVALAVMAFFIVVNFGLMLLLIWLIARRRIGWLRYLLAVLFAFGVYGALRTLPEELRTLPLDGALSLARLGLQGAALVLIFTGNARPWFAAPRVETAPLPPWP